MNAYIFSTLEKQIELGLNAEQLTQFNTYKTQYNTSFAAYLDPAKRTKVIYSEHKTTQSATLNLDFTPDKVGQFCHLSARYGITSGEVGTYSTNFSFAIT
ncbi:MAG: hypothetical protein H0A76_11470 [Candidatus Thiodubiliella endoseptemdiera]|uniref:Uncharacterized protein n=1 Tax=Candidatus Thiodubiliella endoseptemdiera TaxID=2738886 RepID=A0A853F449_9GAMM|nr:hypothetical protein [Candidatus Thiodubiliella endoseptemdiera]